MAAEDVDQVIIKRLRANTPFPAPRHLRADEDALESALSDYRMALARFDEQVLERAWRRAVETNPVWCWPKISDILQAAEQAQRELGPKADAWVEKAEALVDAYWKKFSKSTAAVRAREGGYERELKQFVSAAAWVQGQYICGRQGIGYDHRAIFGTDTRDREVEQEWFAKAREQAAKGTIRVHVPTSLVERLSGMGQRSGGGRWL